MRHKDLQGKLGYILTALLLQKQITHLRAVSMGNDDPVLSCQTRNLADGNLQVSELLLYAAGLAFANQCIPAKGNEQYSLAILCAHNNYNRYYYVFSLHIASRSNRACSRLGIPSSSYS